MTETTTISKDALQVLVDETQASVEALDIRAGEEERISKALEEAQDALDQGTRSQYNHPYGEDMLEEIESLDQGIIDELKEIHERQDQMKEYDVDSLLGE